MTLSSTCHIGRWDAINGNQWQSMALNGTQWHSMALNGTHLRPNVLEQVINIGLDERVTHH
jgi:hypothetical protein